MLTFQIWLIVMVVALSILAIIIFIPNYLSSYRNLTRIGVPKPNQIICKRIVGAVLGRESKFGLTSSKTWNAQNLKDASVWLSWDIRWVAAGTELGKIVDVIQSHNSLELVVHLLNPIRFTANENEFSEVIFEPHNTIAFIKRYRISSVHGVIKTSNESMQISHRGVIICELATLG